MPPSDLLTETKCRGIKPETKVFRLSDGKGLFLEVRPNGGKFWRFRYKVDGRDNLLSLGEYPYVTLKDARERRKKERQNISNGLDPAGIRREAREAKKKPLVETFEATAREWHGRKSVAWAKGHAEKVLRRFEIWVFPWLGERLLKEIEPPELLAVLRRIEATGAVETAHRAHQTCSQVFRYGISCGYCGRDPAADLRGALTPAVETHRASITEPKDAAALLRAIDQYEGGSFVTRCALKLAPMVFVRPGELRQAEWAEVDLEAAEWRIPAEKMKMRSKHIVPLSRQAVGVLRELQPLTGGGRFVFPSERGRGRPMSDATLLNALRRMGFAQSEMSVHGFRAMASTSLHEQGWPSDVIERQLAHAERNKIKAAYNHAEHLPARRKMMQAWADYLDALKAGAKVTPFLQAAH